MKNFFSFISANRLKFFKQPLLFTPGPVPLSRVVRRSLALPADHHRSSGFKQTLKQVSSDLKEIFQTNQAVLILHSTGTGAMEAVLANILSPGETALCLCAGKFGRRWRDMAGAFGLKTLSVETASGSAISVEEVKKKLENEGQIQALLATACETSTATEQPIKELAQLLKNYPQVLFVVDGMTGLGAMDLNMDEWGIDVLIGGSQKGFGLPAGLAFVALSEKAWEATKKSSGRKYYFDLNREKAEQAQGQTAFSSSVSLISGLRESLREIKKQGGLKSSILKCQALKQSTHLFCERLGLELFSSCPANSVTAISLPEALSAERLKKNLRENHGVIFAGGQGELKDKILRIGHLGAISSKNHLKALRALAKELKKEKPDFNDKKIKEALQLARKTLYKE